MKSTLKIVLASSLLMGAISLQNAWGYTYTCGPRSGTPNHISGNFGTYTITDPTMNTAGQVFHQAATWNVGGRNSIRCDEPSGTRARYFSGTSPLSPTTNDGHQWYNVNEYLDTTVAINIKGSPRYVPFKNVRGGSANDVGNTAVSAGGTGSLDLKFIRPVVGTTTFDNVHVADMFVTKSSTVTSTLPVAQVFLSGVVAVPQNCVVNAGTVIRLNLGKMYSSDFTTAGQKPKNVTAKTFSVPINCNYGASLVSLTLRLDGTPSAQFSDALQTDNKDVAVRVADSSGTPLRPGDSSSAIPLSLDMVSSDSYTTNVSLQAYPISTTGLPPAEGVFTALAVLRVDFA